MTDRYKKSDALANEKEKVEIFVAGVAERKENKIGMSPVINRAVLRVKHKIPNTMKFV